MYSEAYRSYLFSLMAKNKKPKEESGALVGRSTTGGTAVRASAERHADVSGARGGAEQYLGDLR